MSPRCWSITSHTCSSKTSTSAKIASPTECPPKPLWLTSHYYTTSQLVDYKYQRGKRGRQKRHIMNLMLSICDDHTLLIICQSMAHFTYFSRACSKGAILQFLLQPLLQCLSEDAPFTVKPLEPASPILNISISICLWELSSSLMCYSSVYP